MNRDPQIVIDAIVRAHKQFPNLRVGQLILNAITHASEDGNYNHTIHLFALENDTLTEMIDNFTKSKTKETSDGSQVTGKEPDNKFG